MTGDCGAVCGGLRAVRSGGAGGAGSTTRTRDAKSLTTAGEEP